MAKANIHTASRDDLVEAGLRAEIADEILKLRRKGEIENPEALEQLPGVGPATIEQLRKAFDFKAPERNGEDRRARETKPTVEEAGRATAEAGTSAARAILRVAHEGGAASSERQRQVARRSAQGVVELQQLCLELMREQVQQTLEAWNDLARTVRWNEVPQVVDWREVAEIQSRCLHQNLDRAAQLGQRYLELGQAIVRSAGEVPSDRAA